MKHFAVATMHPDAHHDLARRQTLDSLLDGRAKRPDGTLLFSGEYVPLHERLRDRDALWRFSPQEQQP